MAMSLKNSSCTGTIWQSPFFVIAKTSFAGDAVDLHLLPTIKPVCSFGGFRFTHGSGRLAASNLLTHASCVYVTEARNDTVHVLDLKTKTRPSTLSVLKPGGIACHKKWLAVVSDFKHIIIFHGDDGIQWGSLHTVHVEDGVNSLRFARDGLTLVGACYKHLVKVRTEDWSRQHDRDTAVEVEDGVVDLEEIDDGGWVLATFGHVQHLHHLPHLDTSAVTDVHEAWGFNLGLAVVPGLGLAVIFKTREYYSTTLVRFFPPVDHNTFHLLLCRENKKK